MVAKSRKFSAFAGCILFIAGQIYAVVHLASTTHVICEHGKIVHQHADGEHHGHDCHHRNGSGHKCCQLLGFLTKTETRTTEYDISDTFTVVRTKTEPAEPVKIAIKQKENIYFLSPNHSPPV